MTLYNIQILADGAWATGFCGRMRCSLGQLLEALSAAMPERKLRIGASESGATKVWVY